MVNTEAILLTHTGKMGNHSNIDHALRAETAPDSQFETQDLRLRFA